MSVVTIRGQLGSGAPEIGKLIAQRINADYVDREIIEQVAKRLTWSERGIEVKEMPPGSLAGKIAEAFSHYYAMGGGPAGSQVVYLPAWKIPLDDAQYVAGLRSVISELASGQPIVIRGRGSQFILKDYPETFHVLVVAPVEVRVKRVMENQNLDEKAAKKEIARFDSSRRQFTKRYFQAKLEDPIHYDLVINTEHLSFDAAASIVINALPFKGKVIDKQPEEATVRTR